MSFLWKLFLPHHTNNHKAHLIKSYSLFFLCLCFVFLQIVLNLFLIAKPSVLGYSSNITPERIIELTNIERVKSGLAPLRENKVLSEAARGKAADMIAFSYWAHISPSGKTPWAFFADVGYKYQYAGENLARDFKDPEAVMSAWMNSSSHKDNIVNSKYQEIGVSVVDGALQGSETTLVVQLFGTPLGSTANTKQKNQTPVAQEKPSVEERPATLPKEALANNSNEESLVASSKAPSTSPLTSPLDLTKAMAIFTIGILIGIFGMDFFIVSRRQTPRLSSKSLAQMIFLIFVLVASLLIKQGAIY